MHLVQIFIPVFDKDGRRFPRDAFEAVRMRLTERFGGVTAFAQAPAQGLWKDQESGRTEHDDMILVEVMVESIDRRWWANYRTELEKVFRQDEILMRVVGCERI